MKNYLEVHEFLEKICEKKFLSLIHVIDVADVFETTKDRDDIFVLLI